MEVTFLVALCLTHVPSTNSLRIQPAVISRICRKFVLIELVNLIWLRDASMNGKVNLRMNVEEEVWTKYYVREYRMLKEKHRILQMTVLVLK